MSEQRRAAFKKSQHRRRLVEEFFGWVKAIAGMQSAYEGRVRFRL
jgi:hypothetical protein